MFLVSRPTHPYTKTPHIDDVMTLLCGRTITWGNEPRLSSHELTEFNYMLFRITCHNIFPISHVHTIDRCVFLYAFSIDGSICFPSLFIQTIVEVHRSKSRKHHLFFHVFISRILAYLELEDFPAFDAIHLTAAIGSSSLRQQQAQKKTFESSAGSSKRPRVETTVVDPPAEEIHFDSFFSFPYLRFGLNSVF